MNQSDMAQHYWIINEEVQRRVVCAFPREFDQDFVNKYLTGSDAIPLIHIMGNEWELKRVKKAAQMYGLNFDKTPECKMIDTDILQIDYSERTDSNRT